MPRRRTWEDKYKENVRKQQKALEDFAKHEIEWAEHLLQWCRLRKEEITEEEYRGAAYFVNKEFVRKPGSLTLLFFMDRRCFEELPECTRENAFDLLRFKFRKYGEVLNMGGF